MPTPVSRHLSRQHPSPSVPSSLSGFVRQVSRHQLVRSPSSSDITITIINTLSQLSPLSIDAVAARAVLFAVICAARRTVADAAFAVAVICCAVARRRRRCRPSTHRTAPHRPPSPCRRRIWSPLPSFASAPSPFAASIRARSPPSTHHQPSPSSARTHHHHRTVAPSSSSVRTVCPSSCTAAAACAVARTRAPHRRPPHRTPTRARRRRRRAVAPSTARRRRRFAAPLRARLQPPLSPPPPRRTTQRTAQLRAAFVICRPSVHPSSDIRPSGLSSVRPSVIDDVLLSPIRRPSVRPGRPDVRVPGQVSQVRQTVSQAFAPDRIFRRLRRQTPSSSSSVVPDKSGHRHCQTCHQVSLPIVTAVSNNSRFAAASALAVLRRQRQRCHLLRLSAVRQPSLSAAVRQLSCMPGAARLSRRRPGAAAALLPAVTVDRLAVRLCQTGRQSACHLLAFVIVWRTASNQQPVSCQVICPSHTDRPLTLDQTVCRLVLACAGAAGFAVQRTAALSSSLDRPPATTTNNNSLHQQLAASLLSMPSTVPSSSSSDQRCLAVKLSRPTSQLDLT